MLLFLKCSIKFLNLSKIFSIIRMIAFYFMKCLLGKGCGGNTISACIVCVFFSGQFEMPFDNLT